MPARLRKPAIIALVLCLALLTAFTSLFLHHYFRYSRIVDAKLAGGPFSGSFNIYAAPAAIEKGEPVNPRDLAARLERNGYAADHETRAGQFHASGKAFEIRPGAAARNATEPVRIEFARGRVARIVSLSSGRQFDRYELEPPLIANLSNNREKRRLVRFNEIPRSLVNAVVAVEDKRFFEHVGFDALRLLKAAYVDFRDGRKGQGGSTITMQLARNLWLNPEKTWRRKAAEMMMTAHIERRLSKEQIFEYYANEIYLGRRDTFSIHGFGEASREYFDKYLRELTLAEAATLAGLVQRPAYFNPFRYPERARERRNLVLAMMRQNGFITAEECEAAAGEPLRVKPSAPILGEAPYFIDLVNRELQSRIQDEDAHVREVYTTLDRELQREALEAVRAGMAKLDAVLKKRKTGGQTPDQPQVALIALDPHTGEVRALVGGRDYGASQLNRALARRQPGSAFKPFVFAAAMNTALIDTTERFTPATVVEDEPTEFLYGDETYMPGNYGGAFYGALTLRDALARSVNVATVKVAESVGYSAVASLARQAGLAAERGTPAVALGGYDVTPLGLAGAYTVFANNGVYVKPTLLSSVRGRDGRTVLGGAPEQRQVLDARANYLVVSMMEDVLNRGTGAGVRGAGFYAHAAGKTGTSRDGWFAGFTSRLLCVVWVGFDDGRDLKMEGGKSALPVWAEFMKRALKLPRYADAEPFRAPEGIVRAEIDPETGELAGMSCPDPRLEYFIEGTQPSALCHTHGEAQMAGQPGVVIQVPARQ